jgi:hypothetical protein
MKVERTFLLASEPTYLHAAIERYCRYVLSVTIEIVNPQNLFLHNNYLLFLLDNDSDSLLKTCNVLFLNNIAIDKTRTIGFYSYSDINLLELDKLKSNFERSFYYVDTTNKKNNPFISEKISIFFKGHGEQSLLGCIGWVTYYFENYARLLNSEDYSPQGLYKHFLVPGMKYWGEFVRRFEKYAPIIYTAGWDKQTRQIESLIKKVSPESDMEVGLNNMPDFGKDTILAISEIRTILEDIEKQIHSGHG